LVGRINGKYGTVEYSPIVFINQEVNFHDLAALYTVADVAIVSSIRDGMNLVSYEFVVCQKERHGVLVLSEFAGSAQSLSGAIHVNPWNIEELASSVHLALTMPQRERELRHSKLYHYVTKHTASFWANSFISQLRKIEGIKSSQDQRPQLQSMLRVSTDIVNEIRSRTRRLFILSYESTLRARAALADLAAPPDNLLRVLRVLGSDPRNSVYLISGRSREVLDDWFSGVNVGLVAEHGCELRHPGNSSWESIVTIHDESWKTAVKPILDYFTERTPGTVLETKNRIITWHFRDADPQFGSWQAKELQLLLAESTTNMPLEVVSNTGYIEIRPIGVSRVNAVQRIIAEHPQAPTEFLFAMGCEPGDEEIFSFVNTSYRPSDSSVYTLCCRVGGKDEHSSADRYVPDVYTAVRALEKLASANSVTFATTKR